MNEFERYFKALTGHQPMGWQTRLYRDWFAKGKIPAACTLPTGLGKTSVIAIWLIALAESAKNGVTLPRRLVYVVNRFNGTCALGAFYGGKHVGN